MSLDTVLDIDVPITLTGNLGMTGNLTVTGNTSLNGACTIDANQTVIFRASGGYYQDITVATGSVNDSRVYFYGPIAGSNTCKVYANSFGNISDRRVKKDIAPLSSSIDVIKALNPCAFTFTESNKQAVGFIAQEAMKVIPTLKDDGIAANGDVENPCNADGTPAYYSLDYAQFTPHVVKCMQEMLVRIETLESQLAALSPHGKNNK
jgi:hypothetical protein